MIHVKLLINVRNNEYLYTLAFFSSPAGITSLQHVLLRRKRYIKKILRIIVIFKICSLSHLFGRLVMYLLMFDARKITRIEEEEEGIHYLQL